MGETQLIEKAFDLDPTTVVQFLIALLLVYSVAATYYIVKQHKFIQEMTKGNIETLKDHHNILVALKEALKDVSVDFKFLLSENGIKIKDAIQNAEKHIVSQLQRFEGSDRNREK